MQGRVEGRGALAVFLLGVGGRLLPLVGVLLFAAPWSAFSGVFFCSGLNLREIQWCTVIRQVTSHDEWEYI